MFLDIGWMREEFHSAFRIQVKYNVLANSILLENFVTNAQMDIITFLNAIVSNTSLTIFAYQRNKFHIMVFYTNVVCF